MLADKPPLSRNSRLDAYLGGAGEYLSQYTDNMAPEWTNAPERFLHMPWFDTKVENLKARMILVSPIAFQRRLIFTEEEPLFRPSKLYMEK